jgi:hypothetical protein
VSILCTLLGTQLLAVQSHDLKFTAEVETLQGVRLYHESQYRLMQERARGPVELWAVRKLESYQHHWISPSRRVWVAAADARMRGTTPITLWVRDSDGKELASGFRYELHNSKPILYWSKAQVKTFKYQGAEQLVVPAENGSELRFLLYENLNTHEMHRLSYWAKPGQQTQMEMAFDDPAGSVVLLDQPGSPYRLLETYAGEQRYLLQIVKGPYGENSFQFITSESVLGGAPTYLGRLPTGQSLLYVKGQQGTPTELQLLDEFTGELRGRVDLNAMTGETQPYPPNNLSYRDVRVLTGRQWVPLDGLQRRLDEQTAIEMWDDLGHRYQIDIEKQGDELQINAQKSARPQLRRSEEAAYSMREILEEKEVLSPNNLFKLRKRTYAGPETKPVVWTAVLQRKENYWEELWTKWMDVDLATSHMLENGTLVTVSTPSKSEGPVVRFYPPDLRETGTMLVRENWYKSNEEALQYFDPTKLLIRPAAKGFYGSPPGRERAYTFYTFNFPLPGGKTGEFYFMYNGWDQSQVWWVEKGLKNE